MIISIRYYFWRFFEKVCKYFCVLKISETKVGIKMMNASSFRKTVNSEPLGEICHTDGTDLYLGPDFLKDPYTLLNCPLIESPHFYFVKCLCEGDNPSDTDYIKRYYAGTLDGRIGYHRIFDFSAFYEKNKVCSEKILSGKVEPVKVYEWNGKKYIYDGKHRAALCMYYHMDIPYFLLDGKHFFGCITGCKLDIARKKEKMYSKHISFFES